MKRILVRLTPALLLLAGTLAGLGATEIILRWRGVIYTLDRPHPDPALGYMLRPGLHGFAGGIEYRFNSRGQRDREFSDRAPDGVTRILFVGDSLTFAPNTPLESSFVKETEARLRSHGAFEAINGGVSGYNACNEEAFVKDIGISYHPDIVVWQYCLNDIDDAWRPYAEERRGLIPLPAAWKQSLRERLVLWGFLRAQSYGLLHLIGAMRVDASNRSYADHVLALYTEPERPRRDLAWDCIRRARDEIDRRGARMMLVVFPFAMQVAGDPKMGVDPQRDARRRCEGLQMRCLDLLPTFAKNGGWDLFAQPDFIHLSVRGHQVAASAIAGEILATQPAGR